MATLNTLRTKGGWIVSIVIGVALLAFILGDFLGRSSDGGMKAKIGQVNDETITYLDYSEKLEYLTEINKMMAGNESLSAEQSDEVRGYAWEALITEVGILPGLEVLGIRVEEDEMFDRIYGNNISPVLLNSGVFNNQSGMYDKSLVQNFVANYRSDATGRMALLWQYLQEQVRQNALLEKYMALVHGTAYVTKLEAQQSAERQSANYSARYVSQGYGTVPDSLFTVTPTEVKKYYDERKEFYKQAASRTLEYVMFDVSPSASDYAEARKAMGELTAEFAEAENIQQFVSLNSHDAFDPAYYTREQLPADLAEYAFNPNRTEVYGPMSEGDVLLAARVADMRSFPDTIAFRQMGFAPESETLADSLFNVLQKGANFLLLADEYSMLSPEMTESGRISTHNIPMELGEQLYSGREKYTKVSNANGTFIFEVYYRGASSPKVQLATLTYHVEPSTVTQQMAYAKASSFYSSTAGIASNFEKIAADSLYTKRTGRVQAGQTNVTGLNDSRELVRWAFNSKPGTISAILEIDNNYVIALLTESREDGYVAVEDVQASIVTEILREKKGNKIAEKMSGAASLDALGQSLSTPVGDIEEVNYGMVYLPEVGMEPGLIGAIAGGVPQGKVSKPIQGYGGVYVVEVDSKVETVPVDEELERVRLGAQAEENMYPRAYEAILRKSHVVDGRSKFF